MALATEGIIQTITPLEIGAAIWIVVMRVGTYAKLKELAITNKPARADGGSSGDNRNYRNLPARNLALSRNNIT